MRILMLHDAARRRLARLRGEERDDRGFAMIFVLVTTMLITIGVTSALVITAGNVIPGKHSQDAAAALAAAQAGIEDYVAFLNVNCATFNSSVCSSVTGTTVSATVPGTDSAGTETYQRTVLNPSTYLTDGFLRVRSIGHSKTSTKTLVADLAGLPNVLRFSYLSKYETLAKAFVDGYYSARQIAINTSASASAANAASPALTNGSLVTWGVPNGTDICDKLWYDDTSNDLDTAEANPAGASADPAYQHPGRGTVKTYYRTTLPVGSDWSQTGAGTTSYEPCEVNFTSGMAFTGPVYSKDAPYLSYGTPNGTGPTFTIPTAETLAPVATGWSTTAYPGAVPGQLYRQFPYILGAPSSSSTFASTNNTVQASAYDLQLPTDVTDAAGNALCVYTGPTRIVVTGATAKIISPLTPATGTSACYTNTDSSVTSSTSSNGVTSAQVPVGTTTIYVQNKGTGSTTTKASSSNPIFSLATLPSTTNPVNGTPTVTATDAGYTPSLLDNPSAHSDGAWTPQWTGYTNVLGCLLSSLNLLSNRDYSWFNCAVPRTAHPTPSFSDSYSYIKYWVKNALATSPSSYLTASNFGNLVNGFTSLGNTSEPLTQSWPNNVGYAARRYTVSTVADATTTDGCTPTTTTTSGSSTNVPSPSSDKFLSLSAQGTVTPTTQAQVTCLTSTVTLQVGMRTSNPNGNLNSCNQTNCGWGDGTTVGATIPQFRVTAKVTQPQTSSVTTSTVVSFPDGQDATQYSTWDALQANAPGDLYVEGTGITKRLSLVAQHDIVVTGPLTTTTTTGTNALGENSWVSGGALAVVAKNNVRIYHPVKCARSSSTTTVGFCANDITGLYTGGLESGGTLSATHPAMQYCNLTPDSTGVAVNTGNTANCVASGIVATGTGKVSEIDGAVFALNGSLMTDNYSRGVNLGTATVLGGIYQLHRGGTGQEWETQASSTSRASSGYRLQDTYLALDSAGLPYVPALKSGKSDRSWNVVSLSAG